MLDLAVGGAGQQGTTSSLNIARLSKQAGGILTYDSVFKDRGERKPVLTVHRRLPYCGCRWCFSSQRVTAARAFRLLRFDFRRGGRRTLLTHSRSVNFFFLLLYFFSGLPSDSRLSSFRGGAFYIRATRSGNFFFRFLSNPPERLRLSAKVTSEPVRDQPRRSSFRGGAFYISANPPGNFFFHPFAFRFQAPCGLPFFVGGVGEHASSNPGPSTDFFHQEDSFETFSETGSARSNIRRRSPPLLPRPWPPNPATEGRRNILAPAVSSRSISPRGSFLGKPRNDRGFGCSGVPVSRSQDGAMGRTNSPPKGTRGARGAGGRERSSAF